MLNGASVRDLCVAKLGPTRTYDVNGVQLPKTNPPWGLDKPQGRDSVSTKRVHPGPGELCRSWPKPSTRLAGKSHRFVVNSSLSLQVSSLARPS